MENKKTEETEEEIQNKETQNLINVLFKESTIIFADIRIPAGNAQPRVYIPKNTISPLGQLKANQKYKIIFIPIKE